MKQQLKQFGAFDQGRVKDNIMSLARPMIIAQLVGVLYSVVDRIFLGHLPEDGGVSLTGVGIVFPMIILANAFANWSGQGGAALFSIERGKHHDEGAAVIQGNSFALLFMMSAFLMALGYIGEPVLLPLFGASDVTYPYASTYLRIYLAGSLFQLISLGMNPFISAQGFGRTGMVTVMIGALVNLILDPIFIFGFKMGIAGAAWATVIAQASSAAWSLVFLSGKRCIIPLTRHSIKPDKKAMTSILVLGFANFVFEMTNTVTQAVSNSVLLRFGGDVQVGVMTVVMSIRQIFAMPIGATTNAAKPVISFNYGAKKFDRIIEAVHWLVTRCGFLTLSSTLLIFLFPTQFLSLFTSSQEIIEAGAVPLRIYFSCYFFMNFQMTGQSMFTSLSLAKEATFFSLLRKIFLLLPLTLILPEIPFLGVNGVYLAEAMSQLIGGSACFFTMWYRVAVRLKRGEDIRA